MRRSKIVCTIGPASESAGMLKALAEAGMNVARLNFSHGTREEHGRRIEEIRRIEREQGVPIAILQDLPGPKLRTGPMPNSVPLSQGQRFVFTTRDVPGSAEEVNLPYPELVKQAKPGQQIFVDDGQFEFRVESATSTDIATRVVIGGMLGAHKGINMPGAEISLPSVTDADIEDLEFGLANDVDWVAASFVRYARDLDPMRKIIKDSGKPVRLIAKIEKSEAVEDIEAIIRAADGIMIARGDLGVEMPLEKVPAVQKAIIQKCNRAGKPVITATQMLDSMIRNRRPTRAEVTDVANAILDGTDAVMLSGETAIGQFPIDAVTMMSKIAVQAESTLHYRQLWEERAAVAAKTVTDAIAQATVDIALDLGATAIVTPTSSGATARAVSKYRPAAPIVAAATIPSTFRQLALSWGVYPVLVAPSRNTDDMIEEAVEGAERAALVKKGDTIVLTAGIPAGVPGRTNLIKVHTVGQAVRT
ncbi:MAG TPA: pyruvate kinase [Armatimonadota bacterium]|nr:pyruvate kinase [Armatimonadota bacterium]